MANTKSARKRALQNDKRRLQNRAIRTRMRSVIKSVRQALATGDHGQATELLPGALKVIDMTAQKHVVHRNSAARTKSRLTRAVQQAVSSAAAS